MVQSTAEKAKTPADLLDNHVDDNLTMAKDEGLHSELYNYQLYNFNLYAATSNVQFY